MGPEDRQKSSTKLTRLWVGRCPGISLWAFFWGQCVGQRAFPGHRKGDGHRTRAEVKDADVRKHRTMQRFTGGQAASNKAQTASNPASSSWHLSSSHKMTAGFQQGSHHNSKRGQGEKGPVSDCRQ